MAGEFDDRPEPVFRTGPAHVRTPEEVLKGAKEPPMVNPATPTQEQVIANLSAEVERLRKVEEAFKAHLAADIEQRTKEVMPTGSSETTGILPQISGAVTAAPGDKEPGAVAKCGEPAGHLIAGASWFVCAKPKGHSLDPSQPYGGHMRGGCCVAHGEYIGEQCPKWPDCIKEAIRLQRVAPSGAGGAFVTSVPDPQNRTMCTADIGRATAGSWYKEPAAPAGQVSTWQERLDRHHEIESAAGQGAEQFWAGTGEEGNDIWGGVNTQPGGFEFAEAYAAHVTKGLRADLESGFMVGAYARLKELQNTEREADSLRSQLATAHSDNRLVIAAETKLREELEQSKGTIAKQLKRNFELLQQREAAEAQLAQAREALKWSLGYLKKFVHVTEDGASFIRNTTTELAGFAHKLHEAEAAAEKLTAAPTGGTRNEPE